MTDQERLGVARFMTHSVGVQDKYYNVGDHDQVCLDASKKIVRPMRTKNRVQLDEDYQE